MPVASGSRYFNLPVFEAPDDTGESRPTVAMMPATHFRGGCDELDQGLVRDANRVVGDAGSQQRRGLRLFLRKPCVEPVDENIGVNECGHERKGPPAPIPGSERGFWVQLSCRNRWRRVARSNCASLLSRDAPWPRPAG